MGVNRYKDTTYIDSDDIRKQYGDKTHLEPVFNEHESQSNYYGKGLQELLTYDGLGGMRMHIFI